MNYNKLIIKAKEWFNNEKPFVLFSFPDSKEIFAYFQNTSETFTTATYEDQGFVMAPFDYKKTALLIPEAHSDFYSAMITDVTDHPDEEVVIPEENQGKNTHLDIVGKAIKEIELGKLKKVVLSRSKKVALSLFDLQTLADQLFTKNYNGFKYLWYHPETALWCGTTPETLVHLKESTFKTISLAGTKKVEEIKTSFWSPKEIEEQAIVTSSIFDSLQNITPVLRISKPYTYNAGTLVHLKTDITGVVKKRFSKIDKFVNALHPTPAVCGSPFKLAKEFIQNFENYNREFYSGFLGQINCPERGSNLFVNLRSMKIENATATIFVGGGIVDKSNPLKEWQETQNKLQTMLKVVAPML